MKGERKSSILPLVAKTSQHKWCKLPELNGLHVSYKISLQIKFSVSHKQCLDSAVKHAILNCESKSRHHSTKISREQDIKGLSWVETNQILQANSTPCSLEKKKVCIESFTGTGCPLIAHPTYLLKEVYQIMLVSWTANNLTAACR